MPLLGAVQTPTELSCGDKLAVLNAENLANGGFTMAVAFTPQASDINVALYNNSGQTVTLQASPDLVQADFMPVTAGGVAASVVAGAVGVFWVTSGLYYAVKAGGAITAGTVWIAR